MTIAQGTPEWLAMRLGKVTASRIADVMATASASRKNYMAELVCERLTGRHEDKYKSAAMRRGNELEPKARAYYELESGLDVTEVAMIPHPVILMSGASPDGLVGDDGLIEIKCPNTATHIDFLHNLNPKQEYIYQMQWQMACTGRKWCDFVSYDDRLPEHLSYRCLRVQRDDSLIRDVEYEVVLFLAELDKLVTSLNGLRASADTQTTELVL